MLPAHMHSPFQPGAGYSRLHSCGKVPSTQRLPPQSPLVHPPTIAEDTRNHAATRTPSTAKPTACGGWRTLSRRPISGPLATDRSKRLLKK